MYLSDQNPGSNMNVECEHLLPLSHIDALFAIGAIDELKLFDITYKIDRYIEIGNRVYLGKYFIKYYFSVSGIIKIPEKYSFFITAFKVKFSGW